jgi:single-strand DNA-binding protein
MASLNKAMIIGRLGRDPELRYTQSGQPIVNFNLATDESYTNQQGERVDKAEWHKIVVFGRQAEPCATYLSKGSLVYVEGSLQTRKWQGQDGNDRYSTEIKAQRVQFLDGKNKQQGGQQEQQAGHARQQPAREQAGDLGPAFPSEASGMDDVPF